MKSYTKGVPLYVQVLQRASLQLISPFLDPARDVIISMEQTRHRLLALSCLCPGASTLLGTLHLLVTPLPEFATSVPSAGCTLPVFRGHVLHALPACFPPYSAHLHQQANLWEPAAPQQTPPPRHAPSCSLTLN